MKALAGKNQMSYGGDGGSFNAVQDTGGQQVVIKSGSKIDSIQIGNNKYGGGGGGTIRLISCSAWKWMGLENMAETLNRLVEAYTYRCH
ncbi:hypothetical protein [Serratia plymuthica]|uniref:hypothetical protein n=1 Tax=Serratia plymuthica TaxID=82996 RepID=UPI0009368079|nr:hypothetical protein [Serratia plymuthica]OJT49167.1 hypothetical protein BSR04_00650 [Serratia plymuthica]